MLKLGLVTGFALLCGCVCASAQSRPDTGTIRKAAPEDPSQGGWTVRAQVDHGRLRVIGPRQAVFMAPWPPIPPGQETRCPGGVPDWAAKWFASWPDDKAALEAPAAEESAAFMLSGDTASPRTVPCPNFANETCSGATLVESNSSAVVLLCGATASSTTFPCKRGVDKVGYAPRWYKFVATNTYVAVNTCAAATALQPDTLLGLYRGTCTALVHVACSDDTCGELGWQSALTAGGLTVGNTYYVQVAKWSAGYDDEGDYVLDIMNCPGPRTITCQAGDHMEWELDPGGQDPGYFPWYWGLWTTNNGCSEENAGVRGFARLVAGQTACGSCVMYTSLEGVVYRDLDYYCVYVPSAPASISWHVDAAFAPVAWIMQPGSGADPCAAATPVDSQLAAYGVCESEVTCWASVQTPGLYWLVVAPDFAQGTFSTPAAYRGTVDIDPPVEPTGACCTKDASPTCSIQSEYMCSLAGGHFWGDGTTCETVTCWACPAGATVATEGTCTSAPPYTWTGEQNNGCGATTPVFTDLGTTLPVTICGTACTYLDANPPTTNLRDNDWYRYGTNANWPINTIRGVSATIQAEFPCEVSIATPGPDGSECATGSWKIAKTAYAGPGEQVTVATCIKSSTSTAALLGRVWIIVRPSIRGNPLDIPCGVRYWLTVNADSCPNTGACCKTTGTNMGGCVVTTAADCFAITGAVFYGQGTTCSDAGVCCPCASTNSNENEVTCAFPDSVDSSCFYLAGGTPPSTRKAKPITPGTQTYCGSSAWVAIASDEYVPDMDCYYFSVTATSDIVMKVYSSFEFNGYLLKEARSHGTWVCYTNPNDPNDSTAMKLWSWGVANPACVNWTGIAPGISPGMYHACVQMSRDDPSAAVCSAGAKPRYQVAVEVKISGSCCCPDIGCILGYQTDCTAQGCIWNGNYSDCDNPNPCCAVLCQVGDIPENEANCGLPDDTVNGGCNLDPPVFGAQFTTNISVCGTAALDADIGRRDTDWYLYHHDGNELTFTVSAEFVPQVCVLYADCENLIGWEAVAPANNCEPVVMEFADDGRLPAGDYYLFIAPDFDANPGSVTCGMRYTAKIDNRRPCCLANGECDMRRLQDCVPPEGYPHPSALQCEPPPCHWGVCCVEQECHWLLDIVCAQSGGRWLGPDLGCDPNPCLRGACCYADGHCEVVIQPDCTGVWQGADTICAGNSCAACCYPDAHCEMRIETKCTQAEGTWQGPGMFCEGNQCGKCCLLDGECVQRLEPRCTPPSRWAGVGVCGPNDCADGACCLPTGTCVSTLESWCLGGGGVWQGLYTTCAQSCGACCLVDGSCLSSQPAHCAELSGDWQGDHTTCPSDGCGACCYADGHCDAGIETVCVIAGGNWQGVGALCDQPCAACCLADQVCVSHQEPRCAAAGGHWLGQAYTCGLPSDNPCRLGACCYGSGGCELLVEADCTVIVGTWQGPDVPCAAGGCGPCCYPDTHCAMEVPARCAAGGGDWQGFGLRCDADGPCGACAPVCGPCAVGLRLSEICAGQWIPNAPCARFTHICRGDGDCDGNVDFADIDYFVAAIPNDCESWMALYQVRHHGDLPTCPCENLDITGDCRINFADIDPFVALIPSQCQPVVQACCFPGQVCLELLPAACTAAGGTPQGWYTDCITDLCAQPR